MRRDFGLGDFFPVDIPQVVNGRNVPDPVWDPAPIVDAIRAHARQNQNDSHRAREIATVELNQNEASAADMKVLINEIRALREDVRRSKNTGRPAGGAR
jgi:hypothetical protein